MALATIADLEARLGRELTGADLERAEVLLEDSEAVVQAYTGQQIESGTSTVRLKVKNGRVRLPQRPVTSVDLVEDMNGNELSPTWYAGSEIDFYAYPLNEFEIEPFTYPMQYVDVTYDHGWAIVPQEIVAVVCQIAGRAFGRTPDEGGVQQESIAGYSYSVGSAGASGPMGLLPAEKQILDKYRVAIGNIRVAP